MTIGELLLLIHKELGLKTDMEIIQDGKLVQGIMVPGNRPSLGISFTKYAHSP